MADIYALAQAQRERLLAGDKATRDKLIQAYATVDADLNKRLLALLDLMERRRAAGEEVSRAWLQKEARYESLLQQVEQKTRDLANFTASETTKSVKTALKHGSSEARVLLVETQKETAQKDVFNRLNFQATDSMAAYLDNNAPLGKLLARITDEMPAEAVQRARDVLLIGVSTGQGPKVIAHNFRDATGQSLTHSLTIARTESLRAYRQASLQTYQESDAITGWQWLCTKKLSQKFI